MEKHQGACMNIPNASLILENKNKTQCTVIHVRIFTHGIHWPLRCYLSTRLMFIISVVGKVM